MLGVARCARWATSRATTRVQQHTNFNKLQQTYSLKGSTYKTYGTFNRLIHLCPVPRTLVQHSTVATRIEARQFIQVPEHERRNIPWIASNHSLVRAGNRRSRILQKRHAGHLLVVWSILGKSAIRLVAWISGRVLFWNFRKSHPNSEDRRKVVYGFLWRGRFVFLALLGLSSAFIATHIEKVPISGRNRLLWVNQEGVKNLAAISVMSLRQTLKGQILDDSDPRHKRITRLVTRLVETMRSMPELAEREKALGLTWDVYVVDEDQLNAFVLPNGSIFVYTGRPAVCDSRFIAVREPHDDRSSASDVSSPRPTCLPSCPGFMKVGPRQCLCRR
jgi:hypothetical protein